MVARTLFDKVWDEHVVASLAPGIDLLHVDRHLQHDLGGADAIAAVRARGLAVRNPGLTFATVDHVVESRPGRTGGIAPWAEDLIVAFRKRSRENRIRLFDVNDRGQGIVHVIGPELGLTLPGLTVVCGDSHTCTHGALGAIAFGIGATEIQHVLATQTIVQKRPATLRVAFLGRPPAGITAKDMILALLGRYGVAVGIGHAIEYAGDAVPALDMESRLTLCNLTIELGAKVGMVAPDECTFEWLRGREFAPAGAGWDAALAYWRGLGTDTGSRFDREISLDVSGLRPQVSWGISPDQVIGVDGHVPDPGHAPDAATSQAWERALDYMDLRPRAPIAGTRINRVFIGSCANSRIGDLRAAAAVLARSAGAGCGPRVAPHVKAWVVPGSQQVRREAESEGLDGIFRAAGFEWREPGCSMCVGANGEIGAAGERVMSTTNRNFIGRQGPGVRTHLCSPASAAASALAGEITDPLSV
jgi:3-isopropylmalate/(R)-2-methylmalate dehydratase large subunit